MPRFHIVQEFNKGVYDYIIATDETGGKHDDQDTDDEEEEEVEQESEAEGEEEEEADADCTCTPNSKPPYLTASLP